MPAFQIAMEVVLLALFHGRVSKCARTIMMLFIGVCLVESVIAIIKLRFFVVGSHGCGEVMGIGCKREKQRTEIVGKRAERLLINCKGQQGRNRGHARD